MAWIISMAVILCGGLIGGLEHGGLRYYVGKMRPKREKGSFISTIKNAPSLSFDDLLHFKSLRYDHKKVPVTNLYGQKSKKKKRKSTKMAPIVSD